MCSPTCYAMPLIINLFLWFFPPWEIHFSVGTRARKTLLLASSPWWWLVAKIPDFHLGYSGSISRQENKVYSSHCTLLSPRDHSVTKQKDIYLDNKQYVYKYLKMPLKLHSFLKLLKSATYFLTSFCEIISYICNIVSWFCHFLPSTLGFPWPHKGCFLNLHTLWLTLILRVLTKKVVPWVHTYSIISNSSSILNNSLCFTYSIFSSLQASGNHWFFRPLYVI